MLAMTTELPGSTVLQALDATVHITNDGVTFERSKFRATGRGVGPVAFAPWSAVVAASSTDKELRVAVAGFEPPRMVTGDPWGASLKRGRGAEAAAFVQEIQARASGPEARPALPQGVAPIAEPATGVLRPRTRPSNEDRLIAASLRLSTLALWLILVPVILGLVFVAIIVGILIFG